MLGQRQVVVFSKALDQGLAGGEGVRIADF